MIKNKSKLLITLVALVSVLWLSLHAVYASWEVKSSCHTRLDNTWFSSTQCAQYTDEGMVLSTSTINKTTHRPITIDGLLAKTQLRMISQSIVNYFVIELNTTDAQSEGMLKNGTKPSYNNYRYFTLLASWSAINGIQFYFKPGQIAPTSKWLQTVTVDFPSLRVRGY